MTSQHGFQHLTVWRSTMGQDARGRASEPPGFLFDILGFYNRDILNKYRLRKNSKKQQKTDLA